MATKSKGYSAEDIEILEDLAPILHRPGMYTDPANPNHALVEVIDNASDEGLAGFAKGAVAPKAKPRGKEFVTPKVWGEKD